MFNSFSFNCEKQGDTYKVKYLTNNNGEKNVKEFSMQKEDLKKMVRALENEEKNRQDDALFDAFDDCEECPFEDELDEATMEELREEELKIYNEVLLNAKNFVDTIDPEGYNDTRVLKNVRALEKACRQVRLAFDYASSEDGIFLRRI